MNMGTFLQELGHIITGKGFKKTETIPIRDFNLASSGATLTTTLTSNPGWDNVETNLCVLSWAATKVVAAAIAVTVPDDYDESLDEFKIKFRAKMSGTTATTTALTATAYTDDAPTTDLAPTQTADLTDSFAWVELNLDGNGLSAGDVVQVVVTPEAHSTDAIEVIAVKKEYRACIVHFDVNNR